MPDRLSVPLSALQPDYRSILEREATAIGVPLDLAQRIVGAESNWNPTARSPKGAIGLMQLMPGTAVEMGVDPNDPVQNIRGGLKYFKQQLDAHNGDPNLALAAYNAGPGAVKKAGGVPNFKETRDYIQRINPAQAPAGVAGGRITVPIGEVQRISVPLADLQQTPETADAAAWVSQSKQGLNQPPPRRQPGAPPVPSSFERTGPQMAVEGLRRYSVLPTVGSIAGGTFGAGAAGPSIVGVPVAAVAGAGAGASAGEAAQMGLERMVGLESGPPVPRMLREGAFGATGEGVGGVVMKGVTKVAAPFAKKVTTEGLEAMRQLGGKVLPAQATESRMLDILQNVSEGSILGGGRIKAFKESQSKLVDGLVDRTLQRYGGRVAPEEAGQAFVDALEGNIDTFHKAGAKLFKDVDSLTTGAEVPTGGIRSWAKQELERRGALGTAGTPDIPASSILDEFGKPARAAVPGTPGTKAPLPKELTGDSGLNLLKEMADLPPTITFEQAQYIRSELLKKGRSIADPNKDVTKAIAAQLSGRTDTALEQTADALGGDAKEAFRAANEFWKTGKAQYETKFLRKLIEQEPDAVAARLMGNNKPVTIRQARNAVPATAWKKVQASAATKLVEGATDVETQKISGKHLLGQIKGLGKSFDELFPTTADEVKRLGRVLATAQQGQAEGTGRMFIQLAQGGAIAGVLGGGIFTGNTGSGAGAAGVILLGPTAIARIMTSPQGIRWLTTGLQAPKGSEMAIRAASNLATFLAAGEADRSEGPPKPSTVRTSTVQGPPAPR